MIIVGLIFTAPVLAQDATLGGLTIVDPWARATIGKARAGAVYMTIVNNGDSDDRVMAIETPVARKAVIHSIEMSSGVMKMRPTGPVAVNQGGTTALQPGGLHVMLMGLQEPLREGERFPLTLTFEKAGSITLAVTVRHFAAKRSERP